LPLMLPAPARRGEVRATMTTSDAASERIGLGRRPGPPIQLCTLGGMAGSHIIVINSDNLPPVGWRKIKCGRAADERAGREQDHLADHPHLP